MRDLLIVGEVAIVEEETHTCIVGVGIDMIDPGCIEGRCPPDDPVYFVAFMEEELGEVRAVLPGDSGY
jgi:hypothetical protein